MSLYVVFSHTPTWVWLLLAYVLWRGVAMLSPREVEPRRALVMPLVFLVWGLSGLLNARGLGLDLALFVIGGAIGTLAGAALAGLTTAPSLDVQRGMLRMPGSWIPLAIIVIAFPIKYAIAVAIATAEGSSQTQFYAAIGAGIGGVFAGLFWGRTLTQFRRALRGAGRPTDLRALAALIAGTSG